MGCPWPPRMGLRWPVGTGNSLHFLAWKSTCGTQAAYFILLPVFAFVYGCIHQYVLLLIIHISVAVLPCNRLKSFFSKITIPLGRLSPSSYEPRHRIAILIQPVRLHKVERRLETRPKKNNRAKRRSFATPMVVWAYSSVQSILGYCEIMRCNPFMK